MADDMSTRQPLDGPAMAVEHCAADACAQTDPRPAEGGQRGQRESVRTLDHVPDGRHLSCDPIGTTRTCNCCWQVRSGCRC
jgi:hypothetical protein